MAVLVGDILKAQAKFYNAYTSQIQNAWHFYVGGSGSAVEVDVMDAVDEWLSGFYAEIEGLMLEGTALVSCPVDIVEFFTDQWLTVQNVGELSSLSGFTPAGVGAILPPSTSALIRFRTIVPKHEGKKYLAPFGELANDADGTPSAELIGLLADASLYAMLTETDVPNSSCTISYCILDVDQDLYRYPVSAIINNKWSVQRRRQLFVGV